MDGGPAKRSARRVRGRTSQSARESIPSGVAVDSVEQFVGVVCKVEDENIGGNGVEGTPNNDLTDGK